MELFLPRGTTVFRGAGQRITYSATGADTTQA